MVIQITEPAHKRKIASEILTALPDWFGIAEYTQKYVKESAELLFWADMEGVRAVGFAALKETSPHTAEINVMGVLPDRRGTGIGRRLFAALYESARSLGYSFLQVKTVRSGVYPEYDETNAFYLGMGFVEFECFPTLWDAWNPCQVYIMSVR